MSDHIEDVKMAVKEVCEFKKSIFEKTKAWYNSCAEHIDAEEFGELIDVIKDLAETEKYCWEAAYFKAVVEAMEERGEEDEEMRGRYGYNHNHYKSSGRFASTGHGTYMGYAPMMEPEMWEHRARERFGYPSREGMMHNGRIHTGMGDVRTGYGINGMPENVNNEYLRQYGYSGDPEYGRAYNMYKEHRRHYTETKDPADKEKMSRHAEEHLHKTIETLRDIWGDVDPAMRKKMKSDLQGLVGEMNV